MRTHGVCHLDQLGVLPRCSRSVDHPGALEVAVDPVLANGRLDGVKVLDAEPLESVELVSEPADAIRKTVCEARVTEAAVATRRRIGGAPPLEHHDVESRVALPREQCRPETRETGTDDGKITPRLTLEARFRVRRLRIVEPEHSRRRIAQRGVLRRFSHGVADASDEFLTMSPPTPSFLTLVHCGLTSSASTAGAPGTSMT